jgi:hypothetical protein
LKKVELSLVLLILLAAAACHRQPGNASAANAPTQDATQNEGDSRHDPHAMTTIDVATGDLSGFANYAGGRAWAPAISHAGTAPAATAALPVASVASGDEPVADQSSALPTLAPPPPPASSAQSSSGSAAGPAAP